MPHTDAAKDTKGRARPGSERSFKAQRQLAWLRVEKALEGHLVSAMALVTALHDRG